MRVGSIVRCEIHDVGYLEELTEEEFLNSEHRVFTIRGRLAYKDSGVTYVITEEGRGDLVAGYIIPHYTLPRGSLKRIEVD